MADNRNVVFGPGGGVIGFRSRGDVYIKSNRSLSGSLFDPRVLEAKEYTSRYLVASENARRQALKHPSILSIRIAVWDRRQMPIMIEPNLACSRRCDVS